LGDGSGESPFFMTEKLAFEEVFRNGATVDRDESIFGTRRILVDGMGDEFFARAAFSGNKNWGVGAGDSTYNFEYILEGAGIADDFDSVIG
jgi:hypothetical protein